MLPIILTIIAMIVAYLLGSVNWAIIVTKIAIGKDIRDFGSGNAGMTNVLRTVGKKAAVLVTLGDFSKGLLGVLLARLLLQLVAGESDSMLAEYLAMLSALLGHLFPIFYKFKGGKGILVSTGGLIAIAPFAVLICIAVFAVGTFSTKIVSVGSIASAVAYPITTAIIRTLENSPNRVWEIPTAIGIGGVIVFMHRANIGRLIRGEENKFGKKKEK